MIRGETLPIVLDFTGQDVDFTAVSSLKVTLAQNDIKVNVTPTVTDAVTLTVGLTQAQSLGFIKPSLVYPLEVQAHWLESGYRVESEVSSVILGKQLFDEVLT